MVCRNGRCVLLGNVGDGCDFDLDCYSEVCYFGTCVEKCRTDSDCTNDNFPYCVDGKCL